MIYLWRWISSVNESGQTLPLGHLGNRRSFRQLIKTLNVRRCHNFGIS